MSHIIAFPQSSFIAYVDYNPAGRTLDVILRKDGRCYQYANVTDAQVTKLKEQPNKGSWLNKNIMSKTDRHPSSQQPPVPMAIVEKYKTPYFKFLAR